MGSKYTSMLSALTFGMCLLLGMTTEVKAQSGSITGEITDSSTGEALAGVNVYVEELERGDATGPNGLFEINNVESGSYTLRASFVGYQTYETTIDVEDGENEYNIEMEAEAISGDEVVVVGYGEQQRSDMTGSVSSISSENFSDVSVPSIDRGMKGLASGVFVNQGRTKPGDGAGQVRIRGNRSIFAGNDPLYVVDGVPISGGLQDINTQDIESVEVLKDASATAIYGSRGSNGVILVTTKRGQDGDITVDYKGSTGFSREFRRMDIMTGPEFAEYKRESRRANNNYDDNDPNADEDIFESVELESIEEGTWTDWQDLLFRRGVEHNHQLGVSGGNESARFNVTFGGLQEDGIVPGQDYERYNTRINLDVDVSDRFQVGTSTLGTFSTRNGSDLNPFGEATQNNPLGKAFDEDENLIFQPTQDGLRTNPMNEVQSGALVNENKRFRLLSDIFARYQFSENLEYELNFAPDIVQNRWGNFQGSLTNARKMGAPTAQKSEDLVFRYTWENIINYQEDFADVHSLDLTGLFGIETRQEEWSNASVRGIPVEEMEHYNFGAAEEVLGAGSDFESWALISYMGRANYVYDDRYLATFTARIDGSSRFGEDNKYGFFPSFALGWNIANEDFMANNSLFDDLRLRLSYGESGNTAIDPYQTQNLLARTAYNFGGSSGFGYRPGQLPNSELKWETTASVNLGVEYEILNSRVTGSVEGYQQKTSDLLMQRQLPNTSGFGSVLENVGATQNTGVEFDLSTVNVQNDADGFRWTTNLNLAYNKEEITELYGGTEDDIGNEWFIGHPVSVHYDHDKIGIWQEDEADEADEFGQEPGEIKIEDQDGDGNIDGDDRVILGQEMPQVHGGMTNQFGYRNFDLSVSLAAEFGNMLYSSLHTGRNQLAGRYQNLDVDYWTPDNPTNDNPRPNQAQEFPIYGDSRAYFNASYVKVRDVTLSYTLPADLSQRFGARSVRAYVTAEQPLIISPYVQKHKGIDPELALDPNSSELDTPPTRTVLLGLNLTF